MIRRARTWLFLTLLLVGITQSVTTPTHTVAKSDDNEPPTLNIVAAGINSRGTTMYGEIGTVRQTGKTYKIKLDAPQSAGTDLGGIIQYVFDRGQDPEDTEVIHVKGPGDPALKSFIQKIAAEKHATVNIDMDLALLGRDTWQDQTDKLASIAIQLAQERKKAMPDSSNTIFTHSAATIALSKIIDSGNGSLFQSKIAASPMTWALSKDVLIMQAAGDLPSTPTGAVKDLQFSNGAARDAEGWTGRGNTVIRVSGKGFDAQPSMIKEALNGVTNTALKVTAISEFIAHSESHALGANDANVEVYLPVTEQKPGEPPSPTRVEKFEIKNVNAGQVIKVVEGNAGPSQPVSETDKRFTAVDKLKEEVKKLEPPRGGGIALRATADIPLNPDDLTDAVWDDRVGRLILRGRDINKSWTLPPLNLDIARIAYRCVYGEKPIDPEFSIGVDPVGNAVDKTAPGMSPTYYVGPVEDSLFGLIMMRADKALGDIAYEGSKEMAARGLNLIEGYHSLPEMYPAKYTDQPKASVLLGASERVVIQSMPSKLNIQGSELVYADQPELAVRFGRTTPVERAFADIFDTNYYSILERVRELRDLVECSRAIGILKWIRDNNVAFTSRSPLDTPPGVVHTSHQIERRQLPKIEDTAAKPPLVTYGEDGPTEIFPVSGNRIHISYEHGHLKRVSRGDGSSLNVYADDNGSPTAFEIDKVGAAAFSYERQYTVFNSDVELQRNDGRVESFKIRASSHNVPESEPWALINEVARNFIRGVSITRIATTTSADQPHGQHVSKFVVLLCIACALALVIIVAIISARR